MRNRAWWMCAAILLGSRAIAADDTGAFAIKGAGALNCQTFVAERAKQSNLYYMIGGWLDGYLSGVNQYQEGTYDATSYESPELLLLIMQNHCADNPDDLLFSVVSSLIGTLAPDRLTNVSPMVTIRVGDRQGRLYELVLERMQRELEERGHLPAESPPGFTDEMIDAIKAYQASIAFEPTGFPDQATLLRLFQEDSPAAAN
jgi:hypothetical protein